MGYQQTLRRLKSLTYYDFEYDMPLVERFSVTAEGPTLASSAPLWLTRRDVPHVVGSGFSRTWETSA